MLTYPLPSMSPNVPLAAQPHGVVVLANELALAGHWLVAPTPAATQ